MHVALCKVIHNMSQNLFTREEFINGIGDYIESRKDLIQNRNLDHGSTIDFGVACYIALLMETDTDAYDFTQFDFQRHVTEREKLQTFLEYVTSSSGQVSSGAAEVFRSTKYNSPELVKLFTILRCVDHTETDSIADLCKRLDTLVFRISHADDASDTSGEQPKSVSKTLPNAYRAIFLQRYINDAADAGITEIRGLSVPKFMEQAWETTATEYANGDLHVMSMDHDTQPWIIIFYTQTGDNVFIKHILYDSDTSSDLTATLQRLRSINNRPDGTNISAEDTAFLHDLDEKPPKIIAAIAGLVMSLNINGKIFAHANKDVTIYKLFFRDVLGFDPIEYADAKTAGYPYGSAETHDFYMFDLSDN